MKITRLFLLTICLAVIPELAAAQTMSFSVYSDFGPSENDASFDEARVYAWGTVSDNSSGCTHSNYQSGTDLFSPSRSDSPGFTGGLQSDTSLLFSAEVGDWTVVTRGTYQCSCMFGGTVGFGGSSVTDTMYSARFAYILDYIHWYGIGHYVRCNPGVQCREMDALLSKIKDANGSYPLYMMAKMIWVGNQACAGFDLEAVPICVADVWF
jgi:hypothetical protein